MTNDPSRTSGGVPVTEALIERLAAQAEQGYDVDKLRQTGPDPTSGDAADLGVLVYLTYEQHGSMDLLLAVPEGTAFWKSWMEAAAVRLPPEVVDEIITAYRLSIEAHQHAMRYLRLTGQQLPRRT